MLTTTVQYQVFYTWPSSGGRHEDGTQALETAVIGDDGGGGGLSAVPPAPDLIGRTRGEGGNAMMHAAPAPAWALDLPTCLFPLLISLLITAKLDRCLEKIRNPSVQRKQINLKNNKFIDFACWI